MRAATAAIVATLLGLGVAVFGHAVDLEISDRAYDSVSATWLVGHQAGWLRFAFYDGPKWLLVILGLVLLAVILFGRGRIVDQRARQVALFLFLCLATVPAVTGTIKSASGISCPYAIEHYGGRMSNENSRFSLAGFVDPARTDGCWPSGHVSGAFALLGVLCLRIPGRRSLAAAATVAGVAMGAYQVLRGAHFVSHIVVSFCIATIVVALLQQLLLRQKTAVSRGTSANTRAEAALASSTR